MQSLKDTFYLMLRDRVAAGNAARTVVVRGVARPGVVVVENELPGPATLVEVFCLRWMTLHVDPRSSPALTGMQCAIEYATDGMAGNGGMDRGRALTAMDAELSAALSSWPRTATKVVTVAGQTGPETGDGTNVFWGDAVFGPVAIENERMGRTATVEVFGYGE